jgi:DNA repair exonuclease SbcCD ATPase subunit
MNVAIKIDIDENFNETIITRFANEYSYNNLSAGERVRVDLSLAFSWSRLAKTKNSVHTNLLILDETLDANLDESGTLAAMDIINDLSNEGVHIFIVSHKANMSENVRSVLTLDKINGFTEIV